MMYNNKNFFNNFIKFNCNCNCRQKYYFSSSQIYLGKEKPNLTIDTKNSTGNEGLDREKQWRKESSFCEHSELSMYIGDENDNKSPLGCDFVGDHEEVGEQLTKDQENIPKKHPAVEGEGDVAFICDNCHAVICKNCYTEYSSDEDNEETFDSKAENNEETSDSKAENNIAENQKDENLNEGQSRSLIDDYADVSCELPDYFSGDD
jgi:hypothetical protein